MWKQILHLIPDHLKAAVAIMVIERILARYRPGGEPGADGYDDELLKLVADCLQKCEAPKD